MKRKVMTLLALLWMTCMALHAQNNIDNIVEKFSLVGDTHFTSAVERDPKTRRVMKVVKILQTDGYGATSIIKAFENEKKSGSAFEQCEKGERTLTIQNEDDKQLRIYMLQCDARNPRYNTVKVTIIKKMKH